MFSAAFIFRPGTYDDDFHSLDRQIHEAAVSTDGFLGREIWQSPNGALMNVIYYWHSMQALETFSKHPKHLEAKRQYRRWYEGFHVVVSEVRHAYGDGRISHVTRSAGSESD